jgi:cytoskeleton protein RodZ
VLQDRKPKFQEASEMMSAVDEGHEGGPAMGASRVGAELRAARQRLGWSLPDVAATLRIRLPFLEAIEEGRLSDLPGNAYAVGFLRSYATFLGLDASEVARRFRAEAHEVNQKPELLFPAPVPERGVPAGAVVLVGVLIAVGSYAAWYKFSGDRQSPALVTPPVPERLMPLAERAAPLSNSSPQVASILPPPGAVQAPVQAPAPATPAPVAAAPPPVAAPAPAPAPAPPVDAGRMVLRMKSDAWVQVREKQGPVLLNRVLHAGETWVVPKGQQQLLLTTGNAGSTEVLVGGVAAPSLGAAGAMRRDIPLDPDAVKAGPAPAGAAAPVPAGAAAPVSTPKPPAQ